MFAGVGMACEAAIADCLARVIKIVDLGLVSTCLDVCRSRAMAGLASMHSGALAFSGCELVVRCPIDALELIFVTAFTCF